MAVTKVRTKQQFEVNADTSFSNFKITNLATPTADADAATKAYVDATRTGLDVKQSVRAASTASVTVTYTAAGGTSTRGQITAAPNTLDGVTLAANDRILLKDQGTGAQNGIWVVSTLGTGANGVWDRATDFDADAEVTAGAFVFVEEGTTNADSGWVLTTNNPIIIGGASGTALVWVQFSGAGQITANNGLTKSGNTISLAAISANSVLANATGSSAVPIAVSMVTAATASAVPIRDANANIRFNNSIQNLATTATAAGTTTLTVASAYTQQFTGTTTQTVVLPDATTLTVGHAFLITNRSTGVVTVNANGGGLVQAMAASSQVIVTLVTNGTAAGTWDAAYSITNAGAGGGTVTSVSVVTANGLQGSVATATTTPAITLSTSLANTPVVAVSSNAFVAGTTTGTGSTVVLNTSPSITTPALSGATVSTSNTVTAGTNAQGQGSLTSDYNIITTAASNPSGVTLPTATQGRKVIIVNKGANTVNVYPATGATIDGLAANSFIALPVNSVLEFNASSTTQWYSTAISSTDVTNSFGSQTANTVYAAPNGSAGTPSFRALVAADIPALSYLSTSTTSTQSGYFGDIFLYDDTTPSHYLQITNFDNLTAARVLRITVNDADRTISLGGSITTASSFTTSGANPLTLTTTGTTNVTLPTSGTLISSVNYIVRETPSGTPNGSLSTFGLANTPVAGKEMVFVNGVLQNAGANNDYQLSGTNIVFETAAIPQSGDVILVTYLR